MLDFQETIDMELDSIYQINSVEVAASRFRVNSCMLPRHGEARVAADALTEVVASCVSAEKVQKRNF